MSALNKQKVLKKINGDTLSDIDRQLLLDVLKCQSTLYNDKEIFKVIDKFLTERNIQYFTDSYGNIIINNNQLEMSPCLCAHLDTVHIYENGFKVIRSNTGIYTATNNRGKQVGIGGDDKCGIFTCLYALSKHPKTKVIFFTEEESGGRGSESIDESIFTNVSSLIGIDRWGNSDVVTTYSGMKTVIKEFLHTIQPSMFRYKYKESSGLFTDVFNLTERINLNAVNISCGYYQHHSDFEYIDENELYICCLFVLDILKDIGNKFFAPPEQRHKFYSHFYGDESIYLGVQEKCLTCYNNYHCGKEDKEFCKSLNYMYYEKDKNEYIGHDKNYYESDFHY